MALDYNSYLVEMRKLAVVLPNDNDFAAIVPGMIDYAEQRIYRELQLLATTAIDDTRTFTVNNREITLPTGQRWITVDQVCVITPVSATTAALGTRVPLVPVQLAFVNMVWPSSTGAGVPQYYARKTDQVLVVGPWPSAAYHVEFTGTVRPTPLSPSNLTTWLATYLPDLLIAASMVFVSGYQRDFGAQAEDPKLSQSWEVQYSALRDSAATEETIRKFR